MKTYKVEIPEDQLDFMLSLFEQLNFMSYEDVTSEPRDYIAKSYMEEKGLIIKEAPTTAEESQLRKMAGLNKLRDTINKIQDNRQAKTGPEEFLFRLPSATSSDKPVRFDNYIDLKSHLEKYFRIGIDKIDFVINKDAKQTDIDQYQVKAIVQDSNSKPTIIMAGFSNKTLS